MTDSEALALIKEWTRKGWTFKFKAFKDAAYFHWWTCEILGAGLAHGICGGESLGIAVERVWNEATSMVDDPQAIIKEYGDTIGNIARSVFGKDAFQGIEAVHWEEGEPVRICICVTGSDPKTHVDQELEFFRQVEKVVPTQVYDALRIEVDWKDGR